MKTSLGGTELTQCEDFVGLYVGGVVSADGFCDRDVDIRNLHSIWKAKDISKSTKFFCISQWSSRLFYITRRLGL